MKTPMKTTLILLVAVLGLSPVRAQQQPTPTPTPDTPTPDTTDQEQAVGELIQAVVDATKEEINAEKDKGKGDENGKRAIRGQGARGAAGLGTNAVSLTTLVARNSTNHVARGTNAIVLNFDKAPLRLVLDYLSEAAGFVISPDSKVDLSGHVTVLSKHPVSRDEAVAVLNNALNKENYSATVEGNLLSIFVVDSSNTEIIPGVPDNNFTNVPPTKELVTQIVYVRNVEASTLISSLQPLMPSGTSMSANQGANAIILTDTKANIRRMVQLVKALDTPAVSASAVHVIPLSYADATSLAQVITSVFQTSDSANNQGRGGGPGGRGFPGFFGGFGGQGNSGSATPAGRVATPKVTAVADERSNSLVVSAAEDQMPLIEAIVAQMDVNVDAALEMKVFRLKNADPQETADQLTSLFADPNEQQNNRNRRFGGFGFGPFGAFGANNNTQQTSQRSMNQSRVTAVPDPRTSSILVRASKDWMPQIGAIIDELDSDPAKKKKIHVIKVENRDPQELVDDLQTVIATDNSGNYSSTRNSNSRQAGSQLNNRQQNNLQNQGQNQGFGQGFGNTSGTGSRTGR